MGSRVYCGTRERVLDDGTLYSGKGNPLDEATWEPEASLDHAPEVLEEYLRRVEKEEKSTRNRRKQAT